MAETRKVIIIGAGASGMMAAYFAAKRGLMVNVFDKNALTGRKLRICGKGRCNITNDTDVQGVLKNIPGNPKFLRPALYHFTPQQVMEFFTSIGVEVKVEQGKRVFPVSDDADDVADALERCCRQLGVKFTMNMPVDSITTSENKVTGIIARGKEYPADAVILATGGMSYPGTGSTGDGYRMAKSFGHTMVTPRPSLVGLDTVEDWPHPLTGLALKNVAVTVAGTEKKKIYREVGEMLLTHTGVSGPLIITASRYLLDHPDAHIEIDLKPGLTEDELDVRVLKDFEKYNRRAYMNALDDLLPKSMIPAIVNMSEIPGDTVVNTITREQRRRLVKLLKCLPLHVKKSRGFHEAIITAGGVNTREVDAGNMQSRLVTGLYLTGEILDVDAFTGGYNLQIAWATGKLAGEKVLLEIEE
ncbi:MAG: NAD(P)/FAD-dependent oxidoreductase [bacterium]